MRVACVQQALGGIKINIKIKMFSFISTTRKFYTTTHNNSSHHWNQGLSHQTRRSFKNHIANVDYVGAPGILSKQQLSRNWD
jgi:hypothetical protein